MQVFHFQISSVKNVIICRLSRPVAFRPIPPHPIPCRLAASHSVSSRTVLCPVPCPLLTQRRTYRGQLNDWIMRQAERVFGRQIRSGSGAERGSERETEEARLTHAETPTATNRPRGARYGTEHGQLFGTTPKSQLVSAQAARKRSMLRYLNFFLNQDSNNPPLPRSTEMQPT